MIKKEINEIKSLFDTIQECGILKLAGCYVNGDKEKVKTFSESFYNLPEEEMYKYLEIFRRTLAGTPGKNLLDMSFTNPEETPDRGKGLLNKLKKSELKDDSLLERFYDLVIEHYNYVGNYLILLIHQAYDVPGMTADGIASNEVYNYILCSICPMKLTKPGLGFDDDLGEIHTLRQIFAVELPDNGFLFPEFNDRSTDDDAVLFFSRKTDLMQDAFLENVLDVTATLPAKQQKEGFTEFVSDVLGEESSFETVISIQENLKEAAFNKKVEAAGETVFFDKETMRDVFEKSGVPGEKLETFDKKFEEQFDTEKTRERQVETKLFADNVVPVRSIEVRNKNMVLRINSKHMDILDTKVVDGKKCLVIELTDDMTVNGIPVEG